MDNVPENIEVPAQDYSKAVSRRRKLVILGLLLVVAGWVSMMLHPFVSLACTVLGLVVSIIGVRIPPGPRRDFAITAIVAASVLLVVFAIFVTVLYLI